MLFYRYCLENGMALCPRCHNWNKQISAHGSPWGYEKWLRENCPDRFAWWEANRWKVHPGHRPDYEAILEDLEAIWESEKDYTTLCTTIGIRSASEA